MSFLVTNGQDLYVSKEKGNEDNIYTKYDKCESIYKKNYSNIVTEVELEANLDQIYDIYVIPVTTNNIYTVFGQQFLFCPGDGSASQQKIIFRDTIYDSEAIDPSKYLIVKWNKDTKKLSIKTEGNETISFRYRCISFEKPQKLPYDTGENDRHRTIYFIAMDETNKGIRTGATDIASNYLAGFIPSEETTLIKQEILEEPSIGYSFKIKKEEQKLYVFFVQYTDSSIPSCFTFSTAPMNNSSYGDTSFKTPPRSAYIENGVTKYNYDLRISHRGNSSYLSIDTDGGNNKNISSIAYGYYVI